MKSIIASLLAAAAGASFAAAPTAALNHDPATYRNLTRQVAADYKSAIAKCADMSGNAKDVCVEEAKANRARAEADAIAQYNNTAKGRAKARVAVADADYALAKAKCAGMSGADKDNCVANARSVHTAALADAKADRNVAVATDGVTRDADKAAAVQKCEQIAGKPSAGCLIDNRSAGVRGERAGETVAEKTERAAETVAEKTERAAEKTERTAETAAEKTRTSAQEAAERAKAAAATVAQKTERAAETVAAKTADSVITTKVKADIFREPDLKAMAIHVETEKGVVMLSGFVDSKADADKAVRVARSVEGVTDVKSAIKVK